MSTSTATAVITPASRSPLVRPATPVGSLSRPTSPWNIVLATVAKNLRISRRYLPNLIGRFVRMAIRIAFFLALASTISFRGAGLSEEMITTQGLFLFFQGALILMVFKDATLGAPVNAVSQDLYNGTLEYLYSNPGSRYAYYVGTVVHDILISLVVFVPCYFVLWVSSQASVGSMLMALLVCGVVCVTLSAMGIMFALLVLLWRQVNSLVEILGILFEFLAGAYLPISNFPQVVQYAAYLLPYTWGYDLIRYYSFSGEWQTLLPVWQEWGILVVYAVLYTVLSRYLLKKTEHRAKQYGLHII
jgi:ABC-2 type transport system permease protein